MSTLRGAFDPETLAMLRGVFDEGVPGSYAGPTYAEHAFQIGRAHPRGRRRRGTRSGAPAYLCPLRRGSDGVKAGKLILAFAMPDSCPRSDVSLLSHSESYVAAGATRFPNDPRRHALKYS